jgi:hypothetical protein
MTRSARRTLLCSLAVLATLGGGCSRSGATPDVAAVVEGTEIPASATETLLDSHLKAESAQEGSGGHGLDSDRKQTLTHFVLLYQIKHALLRHLADGMDIAVERGGDLSPEAEAGRLSHTMAERLFPDVSPPEGAPADKAAELTDQLRQSLFQDWFDQQLRTARVRVDDHFGRWDAGRGVVQ